MHRRLAVLATVALVAILVPGVVAARPQPAAAGAHVNPALAFWTADRIRAAIPRDVITFDASGQPVPAGPGGNAGRGKPTPPPPTDPPSGTVTGASWTAGGDVVNGTGKVFFVLGAFLYSCSGSIAADSRTDYALVLTAGHCVIDKGKFATNWVFIPNYDAISSTSFTDCVSGSTYCWAADGLFVDKAFADQKRFNNTAVVNDFAFAVIGRSGHAGTLDSTIGSYPIAFSGPSAGDVLSAFGYPAGAPYDGTDLTYCKGPIGTDPNTGNATWSMACDMTGGSSGGPWLSGTATSFGSATLRSLNSYGYSGVANMYGPKFNSSTQAVYNAANSGTTNTIVATP